MDYSILPLLDEVQIFTKETATIYHNQDGQPIPRVTEILSSMIHSDGLMYWANSLGFRRISYRNEMNRTSSIGTDAHYRIELFLRDQIEHPDNVPFSGFMLWYNMISKNNSIVPIMIEERLTCKYFGGTLDAVLQINGKIYLVDFKTSNHITYKHFLQLSAYRYMLYTERGIIVDGVIILQLDKEEPAFNEYILHIGDANHYLFMEECTNTFLSLVYSYYNTRYIEGRFNTIF